MTVESLEISTQHNLLHPYKRGEKPPSFEEFLPFVKVADDDERAKFLEVLRTLYGETSDVWMPGECRSTSYLERIVERLEQEGKLGGVNLSPRTFAGGYHFFLLATMRDTGHELVIDPFGIPTTGESGWMANKRTIVPFFGEIEQGSERQRQIYSKSTPLGPRGYYTFRP